jgi:hypothetical protein
MFEGFVVIYFDAPFTNAGRHTRILLSFDASLSVLGKRGYRPSEFDFSDYPHD